MDLRDLVHLQGVKVMEIDTDSVEYLQAHKPALDGHIISADFLKTDIKPTKREIHVPAINLLSKSLPYLSVPK